MSWADDNLHFLQVGFYHTTGLACKNLSRYFIGIELDEKYFELAKDRIDDFIPDDFLK